MKRIRIVFFLVLCNISVLLAQTESQYTQYMYNTMAFNPAYAGTLGFASVTGIYRTQWVGLEGAPKTINFSAQTPISYDGQGIGINFTSDQIGPSKESAVTANYSYPIRLSDEVTMSLGLSGSINFLEVDYNKLNILDQNDSQLSGTVSNSSPNIGAGVYFHSEKWYAGISIPRILETKFYDDTKTSVVSQKKHFYLMGGYVFDLNDNVKFKPAAMLKAVAGAPIAVDVSANFLFNEKFTLGAAYRWDANVSALAGFQVTPTINIGYSYDYDTGNIGRYNSGSHEIFLQFDLIQASKKRLINPRFF